jgi:hypothetical protein
LFIDLQLSLKILYLLIVDNSKAVHLGTLGLESAVLVLQYLVGSLKFKIVHLLLFKETLVLPLAFLELPPPLLFLGLAAITFSNHRTILTIKLLSFDALNLQLL